VGKIGVYSSGTVQDFHLIPFSGIPIANGMHTVDEAKVNQLKRFLQIKDLNRGVDMSQRCCNQVRNSKLKLNIFLSECSNYNCIVK
jgi:hypothetical protein